MQIYETVFITTPVLTEDEEQAVVVDMLKVVTDGGGQLEINERLGRRRLAYPIRKFNDGVYIRFMYKSESAVPTELDRRFRLSDRILRSLTVRLTEEWAQAAREQAVRDEVARKEAAERERERKEQEREEAAEREAAAAAAAAAVAEAAETPDAPEPAETPAASDAEPAEPKAEAEE